MLFMTTHTLLHLLDVGAANQPLTMQIINAGQSSYPSAWQGYKACASYDLQRWFRVDTSYDSDKGVLTIQHTPKHKCVRYAYFAPYSLERHAELIMRMQVGCCLGVLRWQLVVVVATVITVASALLIKTSSIE